MENEDRKIKGGWTIWARQTLESDVFLNKPAMWFKIWFYLVNRMHFVDNGQYLRGQRFLKYEWIAEGTGATKHQIHEFFQWAKNTYQNIQIKQGDSINQSHSVESFPMLTTQKTTRGMVVTVCKYEFFQDFGNYENHTENHRKTTHKPHTNHTILKEVKEDKEVKYNIKEIKTIVHPKMDMTAFECFWKEFPRKVSRQASIKAWTKLSPSAELVAEIMAGLEKHKATEQWTNHNGQYIPHASTWLNGRRWEDEIKEGKPSCSAPPSEISESNRNYFEELRRENVIDESI